MLDQGFATLVLFDVVPVVLPNVLVLHLDVPVAVHGHVVTRHHHGDSRKSSLRK